jgi:hypothetical protein
MSQVGHADSKMTMDVYAQLEQRVDRSHGESFDRLVRKAREQVAGYSPDPADTPAPSGRGFGDEKATSPKISAKRPPATAIEDTTETVTVQSPAAQGSSGTGSSRAWAASSSLR